MLNCKILEVEETTDNISQLISDNNKSTSKIDPEKSDISMDNVVNANEEGIYDMSENSDEVIDNESTASTKGSDTPNLSENDCDDMKEESSDSTEETPLYNVEDSANDDDNLYNIYRTIRIRARNNNPELPSTVTKLMTKDGAPVYIVGTAHFSIESQEDVSKTIRQVLPDVIVLELCKSRMSILDFDEETMMKEAANINFDKLRESIRQNGLFQGLMYILLLSLSAKVTKSLGMAPGGEFRRAVAEARKNCGCIIQLGDRPIHITIKRALATISWSKSFSLAWRLLFTDDNITPEDVEKCKESDLMEKMMSDMTGQYPVISKVFIEERDKYLAYQLEAATHAVAYDDPLEFERNPTVVVGVVGIGHLPGIVANWGTVTSEDIAPLLTMPEKSKLSRCLKFGIRISFVSLAVFGLYKVMPSTVKDYIPPMPSWKSLISKLQ
ncbi:TraB domain-containing protein [Nymphon striatum]|nr:TraB domain-containing protein [Nymphon striatum]